jgi:hypothetical protein
MILNFTAQNAAHETSKDHDKLASLLKNHFGITLETREVSFKGWNWGVTDFQGMWSLQFHRIYDSN